MGFIELSQNNFANRRHSGTYRWVLFMKREKNKETAIIHLQIIPEF